MSDLVFFWNFLYLDTYLFILKILERSSSNYINKVKERITNISFQYVCQVIEAVLRTELLLHNNQKYKYRMRVIYFVSFVS